jgi:hypothetical protein
MYSRGQRAEGRRQRAGGRRESLVISMFQGLIISSLSWLQLYRNIIFL